MHVRNKERLFNKLRAMDDAMEADLAKASLKGAEEVAGMAARLAPKNPATKSEYHKSIVARQLLHRDRRHQGQAYMSRAVGAAGVFASWRWRFVEYGTVNNMAWPHLMPAYRTLRKRIRSRMARAISKAAKRIAAR
ncbi:MAG: HK97-gp10 family putative phage morphogenesis protein [Pseudomonadota bacterium]